MSFFSGSARKFGATGVPPRGNGWGSASSPPSPRLEAPVALPLVRSFRPRPATGMIPVVDVPSHAPTQYDCPFCKIVTGGSTSVSSRDDVVYQDDAVTAFVASEWWPNNPGAVLVVTNQHVENLYLLPDDLGGRISRACRMVALAMKDAYGCPGTSTRQHNEPTGGQDVWHYHQHVFPRYTDDRLYQLTEQRAPAPAEQRTAHAQALRSALVKLTKDP
jgi:histidine triad (HIT) family protein